MLKTYSQILGPNIYLGFECHNNPERIEYETYAYYNLGLDSAKEIVWLSNNFAYINAGPRLGKLKKVIYRREYNRTLEYQPELSEQERVFIVQNQAMIKYNQILENSSKFVCTNTDKYYAENQICTISN